MLIGYIRVSKSDGTQPLEPQRDALLAAGIDPSRVFEEDIVQAFYDCIRHKPDTTFGNVKADVIAGKEPHFHRGNFCEVIRGSRWTS